MDEKDEQFREILDSIPERLILATDGINVVVQQEYLEFTKGINSMEFSQEDISAMTLNLSKTGILLEKKKTLAVLAQQGTLEAYRTIEKFLKSGDQELKDWVILAQQECRLLLESSLSDRKTGMVLTGLGGKNNRLRYFVVVRSKNDAAFSDVQKENATRSFLNVCSQFDSIIEESQSHQHYLMIQVLIPMDVAVADIVEGGINECNAFGNLLDECYFVTNEKIPAETEIQYYFKEMSRGEE